MTVSNDFITFVVDQLSGWGDIRVKRMFGGAGLWCEGKMFALLADNVAYFKVDDTNREKYIEAGSGPLQPFPNKKAILSYYEIPFYILENREELMEWAEESLTIQHFLKV